MGLGQDLVAAWVEFDTQCLKRGNPNTDRVAPSDPTTLRFVQAKIALAEQLGLDHVQLHKDLMEAKVPGPRGHLEAVKAVMAGHE